ncbi:Thiol-disulfide isomerase or thioredoxin [Bryocella elongata]|uniref:Thiol-disulfide isomerase or thioredoxin n=1 Tax=Bryocella elongata TaxID=863522 RepID=A0A1H5YLL1_9BACT|nr:TlpA disulfide reductase family protein [Bryocella elongata]SEG25031.1 Thiol-disulfide isomerase or thioredoxin [Bryocella elongata]
MVALRRIVVVSLTLVVLATIGGYALLRWVRARVEAHAPHLIVDNIPETDFVFHTLSGEEKHLSDFRGQVVFLDLWGTWCLQCVAEMPTVQRLYDHYRNDPKVTFLIVSRMDTPNAVRRFARRGGYTLPFYVMRDDDIPPAMYLRQYPATFLYSADGIQVAHHAGGADWSDASIVHRIDSLRPR